MPNEFDPYREALVVENVTIWPEAYDDWENSDRAGWSRPCTPIRKIAPI